MDRDSREQRQHWLLQGHFYTLLAAFRDAEGRLVMVSLIDDLGDGLSAVYTFYEPTLEGSPGTFGVLWRIELARARLDLPVPGLLDFREQQDGVQGKFRAL